MKNTSLSHKILLALISGCLLTLGFAPWNYFLLGILAPTFLLLLLLKATPKQGFWIGLSFGLGLFGSGVSWVFISIHVYGATPIPLALILTGLFALTLALFIAPGTWLFCRYFPHNTASKLLLAFPACWVLMEWVRSWLLSGFPWLYVGYTQLTSPLHGYAPLFSVYGVSFLTLLTGSLLVTAFVTHRKRWYLSLAAIALIWVGGAALSLIHWTTPLGKPISVSIIQGNIPQELKWDPKQFASTMQTYYDLTEPRWSQARLIVWPEAAIPVPQNYAADFLQTLTEEAAAHHSTLIAGIPLLNPAGSYYNAMLSLGGPEQGSYYKRHLVPFGEYVPLESLLRGIINFFNLPMSDIIPGPAHQTSLTIDHTLIAPYICYEIAYPSLVRGDFPAAHLIITISDDSWFGHSIAQAQHLEIAQMRSLETGRQQIFSTNDGTTAIIDAQGKIIASIPPFAEGVLNGSVQPMQGTTPWIWLGLWPLLVLLALFLLIARLRQRMIKTEWNHFFNSSQRLSSDFSTERNQELPQNRNGLFK